MAHRHGRRPAPHPDDRRDLQLQPDRDARPAGAHDRGRHRPRAVPTCRLRVPQQWLPVVGTRERRGRARGGMDQRRHQCGGRVARAGSQLRALSLPRPRMRVGGHGRVVQHPRLRRRIRRDGRRQWPHAFQRGAEGLPRLARLWRLAPRHRRRRERQLHDRSARDARGQPEGAPDPEGARRLVVRRVSSAGRIRQLHLHQPERDERRARPLLQRRRQRRLSSRHDAGNHLVVRSRSSRRDDLPGCGGPGEHHAHGCERGECDRERHRRRRLLRPAGADRGDHSGTAAGPAGDDRDVHRVRAEQWHRLRRLGLCPSGDSAAGLDGRAGLVVPHASRGGDGVDVASGHVERHGRRGALWLVAFDVRVRALRFGRGKLHRDGGGARGVVAAGVSPTASIAPTPPSWAMAGQPCRAASRSSRARRATRRRRCSTWPCGRSFKASPRR